MHNELIQDDDAFRMAEQALDAQVVMALESQPQIDIPADFAARVAARVAVRRTDPLEGIRLRSTRYGYAVGMVCMVVLLIAMLAFAPRAMSGSTFSEGLEWTLSLQFVLLAVWFGLRQEKLR